MGEVFDHYTDTAGNEHWSDTETGHHVSRKIQTVGSKDRQYTTLKMTGWICPVCGRGLSPFTAVCPCKNAMNDYFSEPNDCSFCGEDMRGGDND